MIKEVYERIKERLEALGTTEARAALDAGLSVDAIRNIRRQVEKGNLTASVNSRTIEKLAVVLQTTTAWLLTGGTDAPASRPIPNASFPPQFQQFPSGRTIPLMGQSEAGPNGKFVMNGQKIADVFCPPGLENVPNAYAVRVYGTSMEPRYKAGETVWLNPQLPVRAGDDVVVQLKPSHDGDEMASYIKEFKSRSSKTLRLWQHNPEEGESKDLEFDSEDVFSIHKVVHHATL
ncbi:S24 family peptidase [Rhizobium sp. Leaf386]|uniref:XRE family transcriptional regulator n=1 Tax=Rhizobium sp. Leaf386 TaxID=1736359 RepID=UPI0007159423|nr:S24 family peptidase [Rhizobium sp. Leaf386]KQS84147.1 hypothetical protein ASG50_30125 [Rhizobium sp. Leaf386]